MTAVGAEEAKRTREQVRLLDAMRAALRELPYQAVSVADVVARARTSRRTFYAHFSDKQDCMLELLREVNREVIAAVGGAVDRSSPWPEQVEQAVAAWLAALGQDPAVSLSWVRLDPMLGAPGRELARQMVDAYGSLIRSLLDDAELREAGIVAPDATTLTMMVGGLREAVAITVEDGGDPASVLPQARDFVVRCLAPLPLT